ncbi:hypothetical protein QR680_014624 [Steinernema hermaphroditum]|uniref:TIL domain-containing protein n=1 Tax=Steinernema hermaphroditum TaxID=289476 RepID=A0AA39IBV8_9BILA|nr:hypothetical protein QR680_014624 [Steinernema hermaphroditum]
MTRGRQSLISRKQQQVNKGSLLAAFDKQGTYMGSWESARTWGTDPATEHFDDQADHLVTALSVVYIRVTIQKVGLHMPTMHSFHYFALFFIVFVVLEAARDPPKKKCGAHEVWALGCPEYERTCKNRHGLSTIGEKIHRKCGEGCFCSASYLRHEGKCIKPDLCPKKTFALFN